jgi:hypothetical protein
MCLQCPPNIRPAGILFSELRSSVAATRWPQKILQEKFHS